MTKPSRDNRVGPQEPRLASRQAAHFGRHLTEPGRGNKVRLQGPWQVLGLATLGVGSGTQNQLVLLSTLIPCAQGSSVIFEPSPRNKPAPGVLTDAFVYFKL